MTAFALAASLLIAGSIGFVMLIAWAGYKLVQWASAADYEPIENVEDQQ